MEGFYEEIMKVKEGHRVISSIVNAPCKRIYANTYFNKYRFEQWLANPELDNNLKVNANFTSNGSVDTSNINVGRRLNANHISSDNFTINGELKYKGKKIAEHIYPVGSIYINANSSQNPEFILGFGKWTTIARNRVLVGLNLWDNDFDSIMNNGGKAEETLREENLPRHKHVGETKSTDIDNHYHGVTSADFSVYRNTISGSGGSGALRRTSRIKEYTDYADGEHDHDVQIRYSGSGETHNNVQPYITVYIWRRTS